MSIITHQRSLLTEMLKSSTYSILILDEYSLALVNTLFRLIDLRRLNITSILLITDEREEIDAHAVYFINSKYWDHVAYDIRMNRYRTISLNFTDSISRVHLEELAKRCSETGRANTIVSVFDRFLTYCGMGSNCFIVLDGNTLIHKNDILEESEPVGCLKYIAKKGLNEKNMVNSLYSFFQNNKIEPLMFTSHAILKKAKNNNLSFKKKALLFFFNRKEDLFAPLLFNWFYVGLVDDLLEMKTNTINYNKEDKQVSFNIMWDDDFFLKNKFEELETVSERIEKEHKEYRLQIIDKNRNIPSLTKRSEMIKGHMGIVLAIIDLINELAYDDFYQASESMKQDDILVLKDKGNMHMQKRLLALMVKDNHSVENVAAFAMDNEPLQKFVEKIYDLKCMSEKEDMESVFLENGTDNEHSNKDNSPSINKFKTASYTNLTQNIFDRVKQSFYRFTGNKPLKCKLSIQLDEILKELKSNGLNLLNKTNRKEICYLENINKIVVIVEGGGCQRELFEIRALMDNHDIEIVYGYDYMVNGTDMVNQIDKFTKSL